MGPVAGDPVPDPQGGEGVAHVGLGRGCEEGRRRACLSHEAGEEGLQGTYVCHVTVMHVTGLDMCVLVMGWTTLMQ